MGQFDEAIRATKELFAEFGEDRAEHKTISKGDVKKTPNKPSYIVYAKEDKDKFKKTHILIAIYIVLIVVELFFYVPYNNIEIFVSQQNVPHTEIIGSGYSTMDDISRDNACINEKETSNKKKLISATGKVVNTSQLFMNVSITTVLAIALYFILQKNEAVKEMPLLDINGLAFADEKTILQAQQDHAKKVAEYVKRNKLF